MDEHTENSETAVPPASVPDLDAPHTGQPHSRERAASARRAAGVMQRALIGRLSSYQLGQRLDVSAARAVRIIRGEAPWHVGDLLLMREGDALAVLDALRAEIEAHRTMPIERRQRLITMRSGDLTRAVDAALMDGAIDRDEAASITQHAVGLANECRGAVRDVGGER